MVIQNSSNHQRKSDSLFIAYITDILLREKKNLVKGDVKTKGGGGRKKERKKPDSREIVF